ncbi:transposase [Kribbella antibiotica]|uniref:Transposase n=1 Tax=Kribbella antibiotica TaxID=190195 RepID=A0A4R4ZV15_9ACTN|nr:transposase [Kribbella antibiotica]TDD62034.1 transposase [Kribbella antibiotica]
MHWKNLQCVILRRLLTYSPTSSSPHIAWIVFANGCKKRCTRSVCKEVQLNAGGCHCNQLTLDATCHLLHNEGNMATSAKSLDPLDDYLSPQFEVYREGFGDSARVSDINIAVRRYLLQDAPRELAADVVAALLADAPVNEGISELQADEVLTSYEPWEIAWQFHRAAVFACPTLDALIGRLRVWSYIDDQLDAGLWLTHHGSTQALNEMCQRIGVSPDRSRDRLTDDDDVSDTADLLVSHCLPQELLVVWREATSPTDADLTDAEWEILQPFVPLPPSGRVVPQFSKAARRALSGIFYRHLHETSWGQIPARYGTRENLYQRHVNYRKAGRFEQMSQAVEDDPAGKRLRRWLKAM